MRLFDARQRYREDRSWHTEIKLLKKVEDLGSRKEIIPQDCAGFWFAHKAHPPVHIEICAGGCNAVGRPKDRQDVELFLCQVPRYGIVMFG